jgi:hypothetical protein
VGGQVSDQVHRQVAAQVGGQVRAQVELVDRLLRGYIGGQFWVGGWWGSPAYVAYFTDVCGLEIGGGLADGAAAYRLASESGCWWYPARGYAILCARPSKIYLDADGRLHCDTGLAIEWPDGWGVAAWHGTRVPREWIEDRASLTAQTALTWPNIEQRRAAAEILGWPAILAQLSPSVIDEDVPEIGTLLRVDLPDAPGSQFLRVRCGTGRDFVLPIPSTIKTALEANSWTFDVPQIDIKSLEVRT